MRILILTDSLGCPRDKVRVEDIWVEMILSKYQNKNIQFYTWCVYGLSVNDIPFTYIEYLKPDIIICQIGIVGACRRVLTLREEFILSRIPVLGNMVKAFCKKRRYSLTKIRNIHRADLKTFDEALKKLINIPINRSILIEIAPPGEFLVKNNYNVENDIRHYNVRIYAKACSYKTEVLKPFTCTDDTDRSSYLLKEDGHHLNEKGQLMVFHAVDRCLSRLMAGRI